ncbi:M1 family metallopeptidase [Nocardioides sp. zg-1228]|uniref:M1 family metallopeptidase n=1 Tax=Nocardioides sp. zg-1228 TaxID=2763008 RepID=UPI0016430F29|nr:M1 family metallopeptidase [Nocardioides sp. zg-1228]MBC2933396.1 M1 family metallopeptidase [Nocardioides sp. zg-1228]QSF56453.1 M1 family metallopeptidase [Nocardioides sp. zg-1228]
MSIRALSRPLLSSVLAAVLAVGITGAAATADPPAADPANPAGPAGAPAGALLGAPVDGAPGIGDPYWPLDGNGGIDVRRYQIANRYDLATKRLAGRTTIELTATQDLASFSLDFLLRVSAVSVDGRKALFTRTDGGHELRITPDQPLAAGTEHTVVVVYADKPARYAYAGERNWLASKREVVTMNEPHMAPWWFPANDHPLDKALVDVRIRVPNGREVVSNGKLRGRDVGRSTTEWHWRADEPMAPYLAFFAAGDFTIAKGRRGGLPWLVAVSQQLSQDEQRASMRLMKRTPAVVAGLEKDLGPYPFSVVGGITTGLDPGFALENQTRPTYPAVGAGYTTLVVHELAHQWFGDDIAVEGWSDIWLNEGFASFMEWRWTETHGGRSGDAILRSYYDSIAAGSDVWTVPVGDPGAARIFDQAVYGRGAMTLQALRNRVGDEAFWRVVRAWTREQRGGNGSTEEFEELAARVSGHDLSAFFDAWLRTPAKPARTADNGLG